jgi:hypothetical protein
MPAIPFLKDQGDKFLYSVIQNVTEGTATPFLKTFTFPQFQPDFSNNAGYFSTIVNKMPVASVSHKVYDAIIRDLTLACAPGANDGMLTAEATWIARSQIETSNYAGTITYPDVANTDFFFFHDLDTVDIGGQTVILGDDGFKLNITNGATGFGTSSASGLAASYRLPLYKATVTIQCLWDANLRTYMAAQRSGTSETVTLVWGSLGVDGYMSIVAITKFNAPRDLSHAVEGEFVTLTGECYGTYGTSLPLAIYMQNAVDRGW